MPLGDGTYLVPIVVRRVSPATSSVAVGRFWLNPVSAVPATHLPPVLLRSPMDVALTNQAGFRQPLVLSAVVRGGGDLRFQWRLDGALLDGQTNAMLTIADPQPRDSGRYRLEAMNRAGSVATETTVTITAALPEAPRLTVEMGLGERPLRLRFNPRPGFRYHLETSLDLRIWEQVTDISAQVSETEFAPVPTGKASYFRLVQEP